MSGPTDDSGCFAIARTALRAARRKVVLHGAWRSLRLRTGFLLLVWAACALAGCGQGRFEFVVSDDSGRPLEGVVVYYRKSEASADSVIIGNTDAKGSLIVSGKHLATPRTYLFKKAGGGTSQLRYFDRERCALVSVAASGRYSFRMRDGLVRKTDLREKLPGRKWAGRAVRLIFEPASAVASAGASREGGEVQSRILDLTSAAGADVEVNGGYVGQVPDGGRLVREFCPGDSAACFASTATVTVRLAGRTVQRAVNLPRAGETVLVDAPLGGAAPAERVPDSGGQPAVERPGSEEPGSSGRPAGAGSTSLPPATGEGTAQAEGLVQVRIRHPGVGVITCGAEGTAWPVLLVNTERTTTGPSRASTEQEAYYDLLLKPGESYCIAVRCPEGAASTETWVPWDAGASRAAWFRISIPRTGRGSFFVLPRWKPGDPLELVPQSGGNWERFQSGQALRVTQGCRG